MEYKRNNCLGISVIYVDHAVELLSKHIEYRRESKHLKGAYVSSKV